MQQKTHPAWQYKVWLHLIAFTKELVLQTLRLVMLVTNNKQCSALSKALWCDSVLRSVTQFLWNVDA